MHAHDDEDPSAAAAAGDRFGADHPEDAASAPVRGCDDAVHRLADRARARLTGSGPWMATELAGAAELAVDELAATSWVAVAADLDAPLPPEALEPGTTFVGAARWVLLDAVLTVLARELSGPRSAVPVAPASAPAQSAATATLEEVGAVLRAPDVTALVDAALPVLRVRFAGLPEDAVLLLGAEDAEPGDPWSAAVVRGRTLVAGWEDGPPFDAPADAVADWVTGTLVGRALEALSEGGPA